MKKLLLGALLVVGATSFGAVVGSETEVNMPIRTTGEIVDKATKNLIIESTTAGMTGNVMQFEFGALPQGETDGYKTRELTGTFKITRANGEALTKATGGEIKVGFDTSSFETKTTSDIFNDGKLVVNYNLALAPLSSDKKVQEGSVVAQAVVKDVEIGNFSDNTKRIYVKVTEGTDGGF